MNWKAEIQVLKTAMRATQDKWIYERYQAVKLVLEGNIQKETARIIGRCAHTVGKHRAAYEENELDGLRQGASNRKRQELKEIVAYKVPADVDSRPGRTGRSIL